MRDSTPSAAARPAFPRIALRPPATLVALGAALALVGACTQGVTVAPPRAFNRPVRIEFVCFAADGDRPTALSSCTTLSDGSVPADFRLIALVPQQTRGEIGAVEVLTDPPRVIDSDLRVPGYTFVETGEVPAALAVSETNPACTWVANRGSRDVWGIETVRFLDESLTTTGGATAQVSLAGIPLGGGGTTSGRPQSMVLIESGATPELFVTLPEDGMIARIPVVNEGCALGAPVLIPVPTAVPAPPAAVATIPEPTFDPLADQDPATLGLCPADAATRVGAVPAYLPVEPLPSELVPPPDPLPPLPAPMPLEMIVERDAAGAAVRLLIGDAALPVIHRFDPVAGAFEEGIRTDGPIRDLTLTAAVPDQLGGSADRRYVYAIDDRDGSVMVIDAVSGYVLPVAPAISGRPMRVPLEAPARAIEAIDTRAQGGVCDTEVDPAPDVLRGVFVSAALSDGTIQIIDVLDRDAVCRSGEGCEAAFLGNEQLSFVWRHRPRIGRRIVEPVGLDDLPSVVSSGATLRFTETGDVGDETVIPGFSPITCPDGLAPLFGSGDATFICGVIDPWTAVGEAFAITWQGAIPQTATTGNFEPLGGSAGFAVDARIDLCARGVLPPDGAARSGDLLAITPGDLPDPLPEGADAMRCAALATGIDGAAPEPLLVAISDVGTGAAFGVPAPHVSRVILAPDAPLLGRIEGGTGLTVQDILDCYGDQLVSFEVRVGLDEFAVVGSRSGFLHRVIADETTGRCVEDTSESELLTGRAELGETYTSRRLSFALDYAARPEVIPDIEIRFQVSDTPSSLRVDLGAGGTGGRVLTLPAELVWSPQTDRLYALDELRRGVALIQVEPLRIVRFIE